MIWGSPAGTDDTYYKRLLVGGLPMFRTFDNCVDAVRAYLDYWTFAARYRSPFDDVPAKPSPAAKKAAPLLDGLESGAALSEGRVEAAAAAYGIKSSTRRARAARPRPPCEAADAIGFPVVMKVVVARPAPQERRRSRAGRRSTPPKEVRAAYADLLAKAKRANRRAASRACSCREMVSGGVETSSASSQDELFGPVVTFGLGGMFVEVFGDVTFRVPPFDEGRGPAR